MACVVIRANIWRMGWIQSLGGSLPVNAGYVLSDRPYLPRMDADLTRVLGEKSTECPKASEMPHT